MISQKTDLSLQEPPHEINYGKSKSKKYSR